MIAVFAAITYLTIRVIQRRGVLPPPQPKKRSAPPAKPRMVAPDDDEDFLRDLDRKRLHPDDPEPPSSSTS
ncbi:MAG: hypothetical protein F2667_08485 [Actinobacteria bacterium]|nr:hypothetical protein [Actinomycetota bacterium]